MSLAPARMPDLWSGADRIPGAVEHVVAAGLTWEPDRAGPFAAARLRRFGSYPLVEDNSVRAPSSNLVNLNAGYRLGSVRLNVAVLNLFDATGSDIEYFYTSRIPRASRAAPGGW